MFPLGWFRPGEARPREFVDRHFETGLNDQHCHMNVPVNSPLTIGDMIGFGVSHPCLTFDKWPMICVVDGNYTVTSAIRTFFEHPRRRCGGHRATKRGGMNALHALECFERSIRDRAIAKPSSVPDRKARPSPILRFSWPVEEPEVSD